ncbi:hypothetical protein HZC33_03460 [Candidatus Wolfebacteria bacterium]|nr:hypothetical protein [Candidatus Wolfebacteria bacterium]
MEKDNNALKLGISVYFVREDGIIHTVINSISEKENGEYNYGVYKNIHGKFYLNLDDAKKAAGKNNTPLEIIPAYKIKCENIFDLLCDDEKKNQKLPSSPSDKYFMPGQRALFGIITPNTHNGISPHYRPHLYFISEVVIKSVFLSDYNSLIYHFETSHYHIKYNHLFLSLNEAKEKMPEVF